MFDLTELGEIEWSRQAYEFDLTRVWIDLVTKVFYWADDRGCSCPTPFENIDDRSELEHGTYDNVMSHLQSRHAMSIRRGDPNMREELTRLVSELQKVVA